MPDDRSKQFRGVIKYTGTNLQNWAVNVENVVNSVLNGKTNNTGTVTLTENVASTQVTTAQGVLGEETVILFMPTTANAATEFAGGSMYVSARTISTKPSAGDSSFTITHANNAQTDRDFYYVLIG